MKIVLPWPPSVNRYWRHNRGITHISREGRSYRDLVIWKCKEQKIKRIDGRVSLKIIASPPDRRRRDLDNILKSLLDALEHAGVFEDDGQVDVLEVSRDKPSPPDGAVDISIDRLS